MRSVTTVIRRLFPMNPSIPKHILENARIRGVAVHDWIEDFNRWKREGGDKPVIDLEYQIYADYYEEWFNEYEVEPIHEELKMSIPDVVDENGDLIEHGLVGVLDMMCKTKEHEQCLVSFKITHSYNLPYCELQESAYNHLLLENGYIEEKLPATLLHINKSGYTYLPLEDKWELYEELRNIDKYLLEHGVK